jgi:hypothetical protein
MGSLRAVTKPDDRFAAYPPNTGRLARWRYEMPGWAFHNGNSGEVNTYESLYLENVDTSGDDNNRNYALSMGQPKRPTGVGKPSFLPALTEITHNRMYVPDETETLQFDVQVTEESDDDLILVFYNNRENNGEDEWVEFGELGLQETTNGFKTEPFDLPENFSGQTSQLLFRLFDEGGDGLDAELLLDNIFFV